MMQEIALVNTPTPQVTSGNARSAGKTGEKSFDHVFADKQQGKPGKTETPAGETQRVRSARQGEEAEAPPEQIAAGSEEVTQEAGTDEQAAEVTASGVSGEGAVAKVPQTLLALMQAVAGKQGDAATADEEITALVTDLVEQLETTDLHGEEVLAGVDLTALKDQLDLLAASDNPEQGMAELIAQVSAQLQSQPAADVAGQIKGGPMAQARDLIQQAFDAQPVAVPQTGELTGEVVEVADVAATPEALEEIDPRFAGLLNARQGLKGNQVTSLKQQAQAAQTAQPQQMQAAQVGSSEQSSETVDGLEKLLSVELDTAGQNDSAGGKHLAKGAVDGLIQHGQNLQQQNVSTLAAGAKGVPPQGSIQLPSGLQVAESQIFDQVVTHISGSVNGESGRMVLRLNPAELGSLKLDLVVEGDEVRANIHAQSQQVQEVLERNLPQLRNALAEQGLKIEQFQVDIDREQNEGGFESFAEHQQHQEQSSRSWAYEAVAEEEMVPLAQLIQTAGGGISLHV